MVEKWVIIDIIELGVGREDKTRDLWRTDRRREMPNISDSRHAENL